MENARWKTSIKQSINKKGIRNLQDSTHWGTQALCDHFLRTYVCMGVFGVAKTIQRDCMICQRVNKKVMQRPPQGGRALARRPFQSIQVDFTELP